MLRNPSFYSFFFFNDTATTEIYTLSLHDALPILVCQKIGLLDKVPPPEADIPILLKQALDRVAFLPFGLRSEEHTSELQSRSDLVCRLLLEKKKRQSSKNSPCLVFMRIPCISYAW